MASELSTVILCGCGARYDVSARPAGQHVRCRRCGLALVVPSVDDGPRAPRRSTSERLLLARGPSCHRHSRTLGATVCTSCERWACAECQAPAPHQHLCGDCAARENLGPALPVDFGLFATIGTAGRAYLRAFGPRLIAYNILVHLTVLVAMAWVVGPLWYLHEWVSKQVEEPALLEVYLAAIKAAGLAVIGGDLALLVVFLSAGNATFMDGALRGNEVTLGQAFTRATHRLTAMGGAWLLVVLALLAPFFAIEVPFLAVMVTIGRTDLSLYGLIPMAPVAAVVFALLILSGPIAVLEERSGSSAVSRAYALSRPHLGTMIVLISGFFVIDMGVAVGGAWLTHDQGPGAQALSSLFSFIVDLGWPALLVAAYHGLAAEDLNIPGRH